MILTCNSFKEVQRIMENVTHPLMVAAYNNAMQEIEIKGWSRYQMVKLWEAAESCLYHGYCPKGYETKGYLEHKEIVEINSEYVVEIMAWLQEYKDGI